MDKPRGQQPNLAWRSSRAVANELIQMQAAAAGIACQRMTQPTLTAVRDAVADADADADADAASLPCKPIWTRKAAAHAKVFRLLTDMSAPMSGARPSDGIRAANMFIREVIQAIGPSADRMLASSYPRLLRHLAAGDVDSTELEVERLLGVLHCMWRLASAGRDGRPLHRHG